MESYPGVGVTSIFRLLAILKITTEDPTYAFLGTGTWSALEIGAGVVSIYLSSMTPIVCWIIGAFKSSSSKSPASNKSSAVSALLSLCGQVNPIVCPISGDKPERPLSSSKTGIELSANTNSDGVGGGGGDWWMIVMAMQGARWIKLGSRLVLPSLFSRRVRVMASVMQQQY